MADLLAVMNPESPPPASRTATERYPNKRATLDAHRTCGAGLLANVVGQSTMMWLTQLSRETSSYGESESN